MKENLELPQAIDMEKQLLCSVLLKDRKVVPKVCNFLDADDFYLVEHKIIFRAISRLYAKGLPIDYLAVEDELRKSGDYQKIEHGYLLQLVDATYTTARAEYYTNIIKEKAKYRRIIELGKMFVDNGTHAVKSVSEILAEAKKKILRAK